MKSFRWGDSKIVPGHGPVGDKEMIVTMHQYFIDMTTAATDSSKEYRLIDKYSGWMTLPGMTSPQKTIEYIRMTDRKK